MNVHEFVQHVLHGTIKTVRSSTSHYLGVGRHAHGPHVWTTRRHWAAEQGQLRARAAREAWVAEQLPRWEAAERQRAQHAAAIADLLARQAALRPLAVELVAQQTGGHVGVRDPDPSWAMGVPLFVQDLPQAVISPVASRIDRNIKQRLASLTVVVGSEKERERLAKVCAPEQRFEELELETAKPPRPTTEMAVQDALRRLFPRD